MMYNMIFNIDLIKNSKKIQVITKMIYAFFRVNGLLCFISLFALGIFAHASTNNGNDADIIAICPLAVDEPNDGDVFDIESGDEDMELISEEEEVCTSGTLDIYNALVSDNVELVKTLMRSNENKQIRESKHRLGTYCLGTTFLHIAVDVNSTVMVNEFIKSSNVDSADNNGKTPLHIASSSGCVQMVQLLLDNGASLNKQDNQGYCALHYATVAGRSEIIDQLIKAGGNVLRATYCQGTLLHLALGGVDGKNNQDIIKKLLNSSISVNAGNYENVTALHLAARCGSSEIISLLLNRGANKNDTDIKGNIPLHYLVINKTCSTEFPESVYQERPLVNSDSNVKSRLPEIIKDLLFGLNFQDSELTPVLLMQDQSNINTLNNNGFSPLHFAIMSNYPKSADTLMKFGADINIKNIKGVSPLHMAARYGNIEFLTKWLTEAPEIEINITDVENNTPLHYAVLCCVDFWEVPMSGSEYSPYEIFKLYACKNQEPRIKHFINIIQILLKHGAKENAYNNYHETPLSFAVQAHAIELVNILLAKKKDMSELDQPVYDGATVLHMAARNGDSAIVSRLLQESINVNSIDENGNTPLHYAVLAGKDGNDLPALRCKVKATNIVEHLQPTASKDSSIRCYVKIIIDLLKHGAKINARGHVKNTEQETPLHFAVRVGEKQVVDTLIARKADLNIANRKNVTPLQLAETANKLDIMKKLIENGANVNVINSQGHSLFHLQEKKENVEIVELLIKHGANSTIKNDNSILPKKIFRFIKIRVRKIILSGSRCCLNGRETE